jgi:hypothetical protein
MVEILVNGRSGKTAVVPLADDRPLVIGRKGRLRIDDRQISRQHARVVRRDDAWYVEDLGSKNGTYVNQVRVARTERVQPGDTIRVGNTSMIVRQAPPAGPLTSIVTSGPQHAVAIPDRTPHGLTPLALPPTNSDDAAARRWGPIVLLGITLALLVTLFANAIAYTRTMSALRNLESARLERAEQRDRELIEALRSDLRKAPAGYAELAATVERTAHRTEEASHATQDRVHERYAQLQRSTSEELAELRRTLDGLSKRLEHTASPTHLAVGKAPEEALTLAAVAGRAAQAPAPDAPLASSGAGTAIGDPLPDVVFVIDASRGLGGALSQALAQVRLARSELAADERCRILVAREDGGVVEIDDHLASAPIDAHGKAAEGEDGRSGSSITRAVAAALRGNPRTLHLLTDNTGERAGELRDYLKTAASGTTSINVTHFHTRQFREDLKALARDHGGMYAFIGQS